MRVLALLTVRFGVDPSSSTSAGHRESPAKAVTVETGEQGVVQYRAKSLADFKTAGMATFNVTATGTAPLSYQWYKNNAVIGGETALSYITPATTTNDNGLDDDSNASTLLWGEHCNLLFDDKTLSTTHRQRLATTTTTTTTRTGRTTNKSTHTTSSTHSTLTTKRSP
jgi:hypothetical protein